MEVLERVGGASGTAGFSGGGRGSGDLAHVLPSFMLCFLSGISSIVTADMDFLSCVTLQL